MFDLRRPPEKLWADAESRADRLLTRIENLYEINKASGVTALYNHIDRLHLTLVFREVLHLSDVLRDLNKYVGNRENFALAAPTESDRRHWLLSLGALEAGLLTPAFPSLPLSTRPMERIANLGTQSWFGETTESSVIVSTHGLHDVKGLLNRIRREHHGSIILLADREHSHLASLLRWFKLLSWRAKPIELLWLPWKGREAVVFPSGLASDVDTEIAQELIGDRRAYRKALKKTISELLSQRRIDQIIASDHVSDMMAILLDMNKHWQARLTLKSHSGLPIGQPFWLPPFVQSSASITCWTPTAIEALSNRLPDNHGSWKFSVEQPRSFARAPLMRVWRGVKAIRVRRRALRICILPTTGHVEFTPDIDWLSWLEPTRKFVADALADGAVVHVRLRTAEGGIALYRNLIAPKSKHARLRFSRTVDRSLARFLDSMDVGIEVGAESSARMIVSAHGLPVFRLGPNRPLGYEREDIFPILRLPEINAYAAMCIKIRTLAQRTTYAKKQREGLGLPIGS